MDRPVGSRRRAGRSGSGWTLPCPADGFTVEVGNRGPETLEVEFKQNQDDQEFTVKGSCRSDGPRFTVEQD